jgi:hypothetical protein
MGSFSKLAPIPLYAEALLRNLVAQKSTKPFHRRLIRAMRHFLHHHMGKHMTEAQFFQIVSKDFVGDYIKSVGLDIVESAEIMMRLDNQFPPPLGSYPLTWTEAIAGAVRYMSWKWHCTHMSRPAFEAQYPYSLFVDYVVVNGFDTL